MAVEQGEVTLSGPLPPVATLTRGVPVDLFAGLTLTEPTAGALDTATFTFDNVAGLLTVPAGYTGAPLIHDYPYGRDGFYEIDDQTAASLSADIDRLVYTPNQAGSTTFYVTVSSTAGGQAALYEPQIVTQAGPATPFAPDVSYSDGVFTLEGRVADTALGGPVEISAQVDGVETDLGAATVNADGTFTFEDRVGNHVQDHINARETYGTEGATDSQAPYSLTGGLPGGGAEQDLQKGGAFGATTALSTRFAANGLRQVSVEAPGQTVDLAPYDVVANRRQGGTDFVYAPGGESGAIDVVRGFKPRGADHDTVDLPRADFRDFAAVLRDAGDVNGSAFITDPVTGDALRLAGVGTAELKRKDFTFHA